MSFRTDNLQCKVGNLEGYFIKIISLWLFIRDTTFGNAAADTVVFGMFERWRALHEYRGY